MPIDANGQPVWSQGATVPYTSAKPVAANATVSSGRAVFIAATAAGTVRLRFPDNSTLDVPVAVGPNLLDNFGISGFTSAGTTATAVVSVLS